MEMGLTRKHMLVYQSMYPSEQLHPPGCRVHGASVTVFNMPVLQYLKSLYSSQPRRHHKSLLGNADSKNRGTKRSVVGTQTYLPKHKFMIRELRRKIARVRPRSLPSRSGPLAI